MKRRGFLFGTIAGISAAAGTGVGVWRLRNAESNASAGLAARLWSLSFPGLDGTPMPMTRLRGRPLLLNFWATWCAPCAREMPLLDAFARHQPTHGWNVLALAVDTVGPVRDFVAARSLILPVALAGAEGLDLSRALGNSFGGLPFSVAFAANGRVLHRRTGELDERLLDDWTEGAASRALRGYQRSS